MTTHKSAQDQPSETCGTCLAFDAKAFYCTLFGIAKEEDFPACAQWNDGKASMEQHQRRVSGEEA